MVGCQAMHRIPPNSQLNSPELEYCSWCNIALFLLSEINSGRNGKYQPNFLMLLMTLWIKIEIFVSENVIWYFYPE